MTLRSLLLHSVTLVGALAAQPALAQAAGNTKVATADSNALPEIIVSARRRDENIQDTPIAVTAINQAIIQSRFARNLTDLQGIAPNVQLDSGGAFGQTSFFSIRGISYQDVESSFDPAVGVTVDGVFIGRNIGSLIDFFDIEQVEVLRGPQGTLFGRNTIGGTINIRTARPTGETHLKAQLTLGSKNQVEVRVSGEAPIVKDVLAAKISALYQKNDGFWTNLTDNSRARKTDVFALRGSLRLTPTPGLTVDLIGDYSKDRSGSFGLVPVYAAQTGVSPGTVFTNLPAGVPVQALQAYGGTSLGYLVASGAGIPASLVNRFGTNPFDNFYDAPNRAPIDSHSVTMDAVYKGDGFQLRSVTGYRKVKEDIYQDFDATGFPIFETHRIQTNEQFSQELNGNTDFGGSRFNLTAGLYFFTQSYDLQQNFTALFFSPLPPGGILNNLTHQKSESYAAYAEGSYNITDAVTLTLGGRYTIDKKDFVTTIGTAPGVFADGVVVCTASIGTPGYTDCNAKKTFKEFTPRAILAWKINDDVNTYASFSRGYKAGGFNGRGGTGRSVGPYDPEKVTAYEIGLKTQFADRRIRLNFAAFRNDYKDLQVEVVRPAPIVSGQETVVTNAASARTQGIEVELFAQPLRELTLSASAGYIDAKYKNFISPIIASVGPGGSAIQVGYEDLSVFKLRRTPEFSWAVGAAWESDVSNTLKAGARLDFRHTSEQFTTVRNQDFGRRKPLGILDGSVNIGTIDDRFRISVFGKNLTNQLYVASALAVGDSAVDYQGSTFSFTSYAPRRTWGVEMGVKF